MDGPVPNVILQRYTYGESGQQVAAGSEFSLQLDFLNTSEKKKLENVVMTLEPGEGLSLCDSSNTFYYASLGKQESKTETVRLVALPSAKPGSAEVTVTFKYEYVDNHKRNQVTLPQKLSIPLYQPDRFEVTMANPPQDATVGQETTLTLQYYNKGRSRRIQCAGPASQFHTRSEYGAKSGEFRARQKRHHQLCPHPGRSRRPELQREGQL